MNKWGGVTSLEADTSSSETESSQEKSAQETVEPEASQEAVSDENAEADVPAIQSAKPALSTANGGKSATYVVTTVEIKSSADLENLANKVNSGAENYACKTVELAKNIDLDGCTFTPIGTKAHPFEGTFDGKGHIISNLKTVDGLAYEGLFGYVASSGKDTAATIKNLTINGVTISSTSGAACMGALAGSANRTFIENVVARRRVK